jgi:hypothetical protein
MFVEFLSHLLTLDLQWMLSIFLQNLHYFFALSALGFFFYSKKGLLFLPIGILIALWGWVYIDFETLTGWVIFGGVILMLVYISKFAMLVFAEDVPQLRRWLVLISSISFYLVFIGYNLLARSGGV